MEQSPLTHQPRPEVFQPKIVGLYEALLKVWTTLFISSPFPLPPAPSLLPIRRAGPFSQMD